MAQECNIDIRIKTTWVKPVSLFICRHIKKKWVLRLMRDLTIAKVYANGRLQAKIKLSALAEL